VWRKNVKKIRPLGNITADQEKILLEMVVDHKMQWHEIFGIIYAYLVVHTPDAQEEYMDGSKPVFFYGPKEKLK
jgi:hypothetical protein